MRGELATEVRRWSARRKLKNGDDSLFFVSSDYFAVKNSMVMTSSLSMSEVINNRLVGILCRRSVRNTKLNTFQVGIEQFIVLVFRNSVS
jgi:hypothetical protein